MNRWWWCVFTGRVLYQYVTALDRERMLLGVVLLRGQRTVLMVPQYLVVGRVAVLGLLSDSAVFPRGSFLRGCQRYFR